MADLKRISSDAIPRAIQKAERYRLLNQSWASESICLDILEVDGTNQPVLVMLLLALTDQMGPQPREVARRAQALLPRISDPYQKAYYAGIINERLGHAQLTQRVMHAEALAYESLHAAMKAFEQAEQVRPAGNDDSILRWNTCARTIAQFRLRAPDDSRYEPALEE